MSAGDVSGASSDGQVLQELRALSAGVNEVKVNIARLEGGQASMAQRMDVFERQQERLANAVQDFDRFKQGAGVKLGAGVWVAGIAAAALLAALMGALVTSLGTRSAPAQHPPPVSAPAP